MKQFLLFFIGIFLFMNAFSQNQYKAWYFGEYAGLNFNTNPPTATGNSAMVQHEGCATICDANGQLLFYTSGLEVWNRNHQPMLNGAGLFGGESSTQSALIVQQPSHNNIYYIFTVPEVSDITPSYYSVVDMTLDGGLGGITSVKNVPIHVPVTEKLTGGLQSNGIDYWILFKENGTNAFYAYSLTAAGLNMTPVISNAGVISDNIFEVGYMRMSPDGTKLAAAYSLHNMTQLFDFDNSTGIVSNPIDLPAIATGSSTCYGIEFSPDNSKLYVMQETNCILRQYNLFAGSASAIQNSVVQILNMGTLYRGGALALGPDNKIYVCRMRFNDPVNSNIAYIDQPDLTGTACNYMATGIQLAPNTFCRYGFPNNLNSWRIVPCTPVLNFNNNITICSNQNYQLPSGTIVNIAGVYLDTIRSANSCDSIITTVNLSVFPVSLVNTNPQICSNQTYQLPSGTIVNNAGIYLDTIRSVGSCDSVITTVNLSVFSVSNVNNTVQICSNQTYTLPSGIIVNTAGIYIDTLRSVGSCDSIISTTTVSVFPVSNANNNIQICSNQPYQLPSGTIVSTAGTYIDTLRSLAGCDSIIISTNLSVFPVDFLHTEVHICSNETYHLPSGIIVPAAGIYIDTLRSVSSCDSIINTIHVFINNVSNTNIIDSIFSGQTYTLPSGETVHSAGVYQSILLNSVRCDSVITTTLKLKQQIAECITLRNAFTPNGDGINDYWLLYRYNCFKKLEVNVYNRYGSLVYHSNDYKNDWDGKYKSKELPDGTYYYILKVTSFDGTLHVFKDNITILR